MKLWIEATRPKTLIASLSPVLIGSVIAYDLGKFYPLVFLATLLFALLIQIGTNFANDYIDFLKGADTKERRGPRRLVQAGLVSVENMRRVTFIIFGVAGLIGLYLMLIGGWQIGLLALLAILFGYLYTGGPYPLGYLGLGDLFVLVFFGPIAVAGVVYLHTGEVSPIAICAGLAPGFLSTAILVLNNLRDQEQDKKANKKTLPVRFGRKFGEWELACLIIFGAFIPIILVLSTGKHLFSISSVGILGMGIPLIRKAFYTKEYASLFPKIGKMLTLYTILFTLGWLL